MTGSSIRAVKSRIGLAAAILAAACGAWAAGSLTRKASPARPRTGTAAAAAASVLRHEARPGPRLRPRSPAALQREGAARKRIAVSIGAALEWARAQPDPQERERCLFAMVRVWAETDPAGALQWAMAQSELSSALALEAALTGAASQPAEALKLARTLFAADPELARTQGTAMILALSDLGQFESALALARAAPPAQAQTLIGEAYSQWALREPEAAAESARSMPAGPLQRAALSEVEDAWAGSDPTSLAGYLLSVPTDEDRTDAFRKTMTRWAERDPAGLGEWLGGLPPGPDFDTGAEALVALENERFGRADSALPWVEMISDPRRRLQSMVRTIDQWRESDVGGARAYLAGAAWLEPSQRGMLLRELEFAR